MAVKPQAFIDLDEGLAGKLTSLWRPTAKKIAAHILKAFESGDYDEIHKILDDVDLSFYARKERKAIEFAGHSALMFGVSRHNAGNLKMAKFLDNPDDKGIVKASSDQFEKILKASNQRVKTLMLKVLDFLDGEIRKSILDPAGAVEKSMVRVGEESMALVSSLHTSRLAQYGFCVEADLRGLKSYTINEQLDQRTCPVCALMHGKTFTVEVLYNRLDKLIRVDNVDDLKTMSPFPKQDSASMERMRAMSDSELAASGWDSPPFHPLCRGYVDETSSVPTWENIDVTEIASPTLALPPGVIAPTTGRGTVAEAVTALQVEEWLEQLMY